MDPSSQLAKTAGNFLSPERIGWIGSIGRGRWKQEIGNMPVPEQGGEKRFAFVVVPGAGGVVGAAGGAIVPGKIAQDDFFGWGTSDFGGFDGSGIAGLW